MTGLPDLVSDLTKMIQYSLAEKKNSKHAHKVGNNGQKVHKKKKKSLNFQVTRKNLKKIAQSQLNFAPSHDGETMTFRNSALQLAV